jgi:lactate dehydrogenase-like 2-hydroxyacid dehydrogenase
MPNVIVYYTHQVPREGPDLLRPYCLVLENKSEETPTKQEVIQASKEAFALCWFVPDIIDEEVISSCHNLRILAGFPRGYDNVDVVAATRRGIWVTIGPETMVEPTADLTWALILSITRKLIVADAFVRTSRHSGWHPTRLMGHQVFRKTLGIIGMGKLGRAIAKRATGFEMNLLYCEKAPIEKAVEMELKLRFMPLDALLKESDFVCIATPLTEDTFHQISSRELALMKPSAYLINPARGSEVDEEAVAYALRNGIIAGYAADVFEMEDKQFSTRPLKVTPGLIDQPERTILSPHIATGVKETRVEQARYQALNVLQALRGERPVGAVNEVPLYPPLI